MSLDAWRQKCAFLIQDPGHYPGRPWDNVCLERAAAEPHWLLSRPFGQLNPLLQKLPQAENTLLARHFGGVELSGGQWQRVVLARAIATDAPGTTNTKCIDD